MPSRLYRAATINIFISFNTVAKNSSNALANALACLVANAVTVDPIEKRINYSW